MRDLWRAPEDHRRPDRFSLDPDLFGGIGLPAVPPPRAPPPFEFVVWPPPRFAPCAERRREKCVLNGLIEYRIGPATGPQTTKPYCEPCQTTCNRSSASLPCPLGVFGALTRGPKRCLILPILQTSTFEDGSISERILWFSIRLIQIETFVADDWNSEKRTICFV